MAELSKSKVILRIAIPNLLQINPISCYAYKPDFFISKFVPCPAAIFGIKAPCPQGWAGDQKATCHHSSSSRYP